MLYLGISFIIGMFFYYLYRIYKLTIEIKYSNFRIKNLIAIGNARKKASGRLSDLTQAIEIYKKTQINYIDFETIKNLLDFLVAYNKHIKNEKEAKQLLEDLNISIQTEYNSLQGKYHSNLLDSYYKELQEGLESFRTGIIDLYVQSYSFLDMVKSIYESILGDKIIIDAIMQDAINREDYLEAAELRDLLKQID
jgi:hypothetical protein